MIFTPLKNRFLSLSDNVKGALPLMLSAMLFAVLSVIIKELGKTLHVTQIILCRQVVMTLIVLPVIVRGFPGVLKTSHPYLQLTRIGLALAGMLLAFSSIIHLPLADATALGFAKSFFITIFAIIILKEMVGIRRWMAVGMGFLGVLVMLRPGTDAFTMYGAMAVGGAACAGAVMVIIRLMSREDSPTTILAWQATGVGLIIALPGFYFWKMPTPHEWVLLVAMGATSYATQITNISAYKWGEASLLASLDYVRLLYATVLGWLIYSTLPGTATIVGALMIIAASVYTILRERHHRQEITQGPSRRGLG